MPENPIGVDTSKIDTEAIREHSQFVDQSIEEQKKFDESTALANEQERASDAQALAEQQDPRNAKKWGVGAVAKEISSAIGGGVTSAAGSVVTFPERTIDALSGEMSRVGVKEYRPDWNPFVDYDNPIETKTWWGDLLRNGVHFGVLAAGTTAAIAASPLGAAAAGATGATAWGIRALSNNWVRAAAVGAVSDLISEQSDKDNALGTLRDRYGFIDTPISTNDDDHPIVYKLKNIVEGMGIGAIADGVFRILGKGSSKVINKIKARNASVDAQKLEMGTKQLELPGFGGYKNPSDSWQGAPTSKTSMDETLQLNKRVNKEWGAEDGSIGSVTTPAQLKRWDLDDKELNSIAKELLSADSYQASIRRINQGLSTMDEEFGESLEMAYRTLQGRNAIDDTAAEYWADYFAKQDFSSDADMYNWVSKNVVAADLVIGSLLREVRDLGIAGREIADIADLGDIDGPASAIVDKIMVGLTEVKRSRILASDKLRDLNLGNQARNKLVKDTLAEEVTKSRESIKTILNLAGKSADDDVMKALFEVFSTMKDVNSLDDFDAWARKTLRGGDIDGKIRTGVVIKELQGVMVHSILSGPKTSMRAIMGTSTATFLRPLSTAIGATLQYPFSGDSATIKASMSSLNAMMQAIPESFDLFKTKLNSYWSGDMSTIKTRFSEINRGDERWELLRRWSESEQATIGDQVAFKIGNIARRMNDSSLLTYSTKIMAATDDAFTYLLGRAKAREKSMRYALDLQGKGTLGEITPDVLRTYDDKFYGEIFDANGNILDEAVNFAKREVTLTQDLTGFAKGLNDVFESAPWAKPFFLFARTGVNGIALTAKHTPGFNFLVKEFNDIAFADITDLSGVAKYGINTAEELANAKALQTGRLAMGSGVIMMANWAFMSGNLTGNGPTDRQKRQMWIDSGWQPRSIKLGDVWVKYDSMEPFNQILSTIADVGDHSQLMGEEWTEKQLLSTALVVGQGVASKSYLAGMQQFVDLFAGRRGQTERIVAGLLNNTVPLAGLRNELGNLFTPHMRELGSGIDQAIRNRNKISENLTGDPLAVKYDMLNGQPIKDYDFMTRMFNMFSPVQFNLDQGPGRQLLYNSGYDMRMSTYYSPDGYDLSDSPEIRSMFQKAIGDTNLELKLNKLAERPDVQQSLRLMQANIKAGIRDHDALTYKHVQLIHNLFEKARAKGWAKLFNESAVQDLMAAERRKKIQQNRIEKQSRQVAPVLSMYR